MKEYPREPWGNHLARLNFRQGEHVLICGPTSSGKTQLAAPILGRRGWVLGLFNKAHDKTAQKEYKGWKRIKYWPRNGLREDETRVMLWPDQLGTIRETAAMHASEFRKALDAIAKQGNRAIYIDEMLYAQEMCKLEPEISYLHYFARSHGISAITSAQRPLRIPRVIMSSVTHAYFAKTTDSNDIKRISEMGGVDAKELAWNLGRLTNRHDFIYVNPLGDAPAAIVNTRR